MLNELGHHGPGTCTARLPILLRSVLEYGARFAHIASGNLAAFVLSVRTSFEAIGVVCPVALKSNLQLSIHNIQ